MASVPGPAVGGINVGSGESAVKIRTAKTAATTTSLFPVNEFHFFLKYSTNANEERLFASVRHYPPERNTLKSIRVIYRNVVKGRSVGGIGSGEVGAVLDAAFRAESGKRAAARDARLPACPGTVRNGGIPRPDIRGQRSSQGSRRRIALNVVKVDDWPVSMTEDVKTPEEE